MNFESKKTEIIVTQSGVKSTDGVSLNSGLLGNTNYKIYIPTLEEKFIYVGLTKQKLGTKFQQGFRSYLKDLNGSRVGGYGGYKWIKKHIETGVKLTLYVFDLGHQISKNEAESIEAEIVFIVRQTTNKWPLEQNEIHFNNGFPKSYTRAQEIFQKIK